MILELHKPSQQPKYRYSKDSGWFKIPNTDGELINRFLDALALLSTPAPGGRNVTACALDRTFLPKDESPSREFSTFLPLFT